MEKKRILCFIDSLVSGGAQRQLVGLAKLLKDNHYDVKVITYYDLPFYKPFLDEHKVRYELLPNGQNKVMRMYYVYKAIKEYAPDVVISFMDTPSMITCIIKKFYNKFKLIVSDRNTTQAIAWKDKLKFYLFKSAEAIVPNSESQHQFITEHYPDLGVKTTTITNFVDTDSFSPSEVKKEESNICQIIGVGRIIRQKNILRFLDALKVVKKECGEVFNVKWYGAKFDYYDECQQRLKDNKLENVFEFLPPTLDIKREYWKSDVFCLPSIYEGFPNVLCEAMSCGLPVLVSDICDNSKIVSRGKNGFLFPPKDVDLMAKEIIRFINLRLEKRLEMGAFSRDIAEAKFSSQVFISKYMNLINQLLG